MESATSANEPVATADEAVTSDYGVGATDEPVADNVTTATPADDVVEASSVAPTPPVEHISTTRNVPSFLRVFVEASPRQFCETVGMFKKAVADLLTKGSGRVVSSDQVVLRNFGRDQCSISDAQDNSTSADGLLLPVELHLVDEAVKFDRQLNEAFTLIWGQEGMDFPLRILKVDVVATQDEFMTSSVDKAGVIAAIAISCIGAVCLLLLTVLLIVMRKRQKKFNYGMRCTPVSLDAYSLDSVSIHDSVRRKAGLRASKRSYGNPAFDDPSAPSHPLNFAGLSAFSTERGAMEDEFARIPHVTPKGDEQPPGSETKNRYANVLPLPETRVVLASSPQQQLGDYINANYVAGPKNAVNFYIACQAPLLSTVTDFWRMIWEQQSKVIMMLTELVENGVEKCADYLPPSEVLDCHRLFGDFQVTLKKREVREKYVISTLQLKNLESNSWREITHLWYVSWPSQGVPEEPNSMIAFLIEARSYMKDRGGPSVVHCSPGTGRTGTVLACDLSIREFEHTRQVDIPRCVARLRRDRAGCVQTRDQYAFIYQVLNLYATKLTGGALDSI